MNTGISYNSSRDTFVEVDSLNQIWFVGWIQKSPGPHSEINVAKYDTYGNAILATSVMFTAFNSNNLAGGVVLDPAGYAYVAGGTDAGGGQMGVLKLDSNLNTIWVRTYSGIPRATAMTIDDSGSLYVTAGNMAYKLDSSGNTIWASVVGGTWHSGITWQNGNLYVASTISNVTNDFKVTKLADSNGSVQWVRTYDSFADDVVYDVAADSSGVYAAGYSSTSPMQSSRVIKYDHSGNLLWATSYGATITANNSYDIKLDGIGGLYLGGFANTGTYDFQVLKFDTNGNFDWKVNYNSPTWPTWDIGMGLAIGSGGADVYLGGRRGDGSTWNSQLVKFGLTCPAGPPTTSTFTATHTPSPSQSVTPTWSVSESVTNSPTQTASESAAVTDSATPSLTNTYTPTPTPTGTQTPAASITPSPSETPSMTGSATPSVTNVPSETQSPTPSFSLTPTETKTLLSTSTWTVTAVDTTTASPSVTATFTESAVHTSTVSSTATESSSPTQTISASASPTPNLTSSFSNTGTVTYTFSCTLSPTLSPSPTITGTPTRSSTPQTSLTVSPTITAIISSTSTVTASIVVTVTPTPMFAISSAGGSCDLKLKHSQAVPNPNPKSIRLNFDGVADRVSLKLYTEAMTLALDYQAHGTYGPGWCALQLPADFIFLPGGLYFGRLEASNSCGSTKLSHPIEVMVIR